MPSCGGVVGVGMSLCNTCGLDLDTGQRIAPSTSSTPTRCRSPRGRHASLGVLFVGSLAAMINLLLAIASFVNYAKGQGAGMLCLHGRSGCSASTLGPVPPPQGDPSLFLALGLGVAIGAIFLIAKPIWDATWLPTPSRPTRRSQPAG